MITKTSKTRWLAFCMTLVLLAVAAQLVVPTGLAQEPMGHLTITGKVRINGQPAATGDVFSSGGTVETAKGSSAVVSLGKLGRVEVLPETRMKLRFDDASISILLDTGSVRVATGPGVSATITARDDR